MNKATDAGPLSQNYLIPASVLFGGLLVGADKMQRAVQVPSALIDVILGLVVLFVVGSMYATKKLAARRMLPGVKTPAAPATPPAEEAK